MKITTQPTAENPLMSASTMDRSRGSDFASRKTRKSLKRRRITTGNFSKMKERGDISMKPTTTIKNCEISHARTTVNGWFDICERCR